MNDRAHPAAHAEHACPPEVADIFPPAAIVGVCAFAVAGVFSAVAPEFLGERARRQEPRARGPAGVSVLRDGHVGAADRQSDPEASRAGRRVRGPDRRAGLARGGAGGPVDGRCCFCPPPSRASARGSRSASAWAPSTRRSATSGARPTPPISSSSTAGVALPVVGVGFVALAVGMVTAGLLFCGIVGLCVLGVLFTLRRRRLA